MKRLVFIEKINRFFIEFLFGKLKKVLIFALAITNCRRSYWRNGRAVECGSLENC